MIAHTIDIVTAPCGDVAFYVNGYLQKAHGKDISVDYGHNMVDIRRRRVLYRPHTWPIRLEDALAEEVEG